MSDIQPRNGLNDQVAKLTAQVRGWFQSLSRPARIMLLVTASAALLFGGFTLFQKASEPYTPVFSQLDRDDAAAVVAKLKEMKVPYRLESDGTSIEVPDSRVHELRLELAGAGLPRGGGVGFESFDKMRLGATDFEQRVLFRRALEGELVRTIGTLSAVESVRVHLVLPERSVFVARNEPASASIVLRLRPARSLGTSEVAGVVHLVASAVPGLDANRIAVVTTEGTMLHRPRRPGAEGPDGSGDDDDARAASRSYETSLEDRVRAMLERVVGPGHADVRVTAEVDPSRVERTEEHFDPAHQALRSEEQSIERTSGEPDESVAGVPGAESNLPGSTGKAAPSASSSAPPAAVPAPSSVVATAPTRETHTRNYEIDRVSEKRVTGSGALKRLTVAVVLDGLRDGDHIRPRGKEELDKLAALVKSAAGANDARGDVVTLDSLPFTDAVEPPPAPSPMPLGLSDRIQQGKRYGLPAAGALLVLVLALVALRRARGGRAVLVSAKELPLPADMTSLPSADAPPLPLGDLRVQALARAKEDPATAALVVRFWLGTTGAGAGEPPAA